MTGATKAVWIIVGLIALACLAGMWLTGCGAMERPIPVSWWDQVPGA